MLSIFTRLLKTLKKKSKKYNIQKNWLKCVYYPYITCILLLKISRIFMVFGKRKTPEILDFRGFKNFLCYCFLSFFERFYAYLQFFCIQPVYY